MDKQKRNRLLLIFRQFREAITGVEWSVQFWGHFLQHTLQDHWLDKQDNRMVYQAIFAAFDIPADRPDGWLWTAPHHPRLIRANDLEAFRQEFFLMVRNLALVKSYNALEMFLFQAALLAYFPEELPAQGKSASKKGEELIKRAFRSNPSIGNFDTTNNRHLIAYLKFQSPDFATFIAQLARIDMKTTWAGFFEFISIIRNVNTHHGALLTSDTINQLKGASKDVFERSFTYIEDHDDLFALQPKEGDPFSLIITLIKDLAVNAVKFIFDQPNLSFLDLYKS